MLTFNDDDDALVAQFESSIQIDEKRLRTGLEAVGMELQNWLRSLTDETRPPPGARMVTYADGTSKLYVPPRYRGEGDRQAHPGHWADVTGQLALGYKSDVSRESGSIWVLEMSNNTKYAAALQSLEGYWVLEGVFDSEERLSDLFTQYVLPALPD